MLIAIDTSPLESASRGRGVGTYTRELIKALQQQSTTLRFEFTSTPTKVRADLIHYPYFDLFFHTLPIVKPTKVIITIHDLIPLIFPQQFPPGIKGALRYYLQRFSLLNIASIITDSHSSRKDIHHFFYISLDKIHSIPLAASSHFKPAPNTQVSVFRDKHHLPKKFLAYVGDINYNKNLGNLIRALNNIDLPLIIATRAQLTTTIKEKQTSIAINTINQAISQLHHPHQTRLLSLNKPSDLNLFYNAATCYIQPSLYEGFGLPVLEAMQAGTPVICSNASSLPEVAGNAPVMYFDPNDSSSITQALTLAQHLSTKQKNRYSKKGLFQARQFSWQKTARETIKVYQSILKK